MINTFEKFMSSEHTGRRNAVTSREIEAKFRCKDKKRYIEEYAEAVSEVAYRLVAEHKQAEKLLQIAKERGKL